jgi:hypothetical protein
MPDLSTLDTSPPATSGPSPRRRWLLVGAAVAVLALIVALVVVLTRGDDEPVVTSDETTTSVEPSTTTTEAPTTTVDEATSTTAAPSTTSATEPTPAVNGEIVARGDLDGDGHDELFAKAPMGAYTDGISVYTLGDDGSAIPVTLNGTPAVFPVGASALHLAGLRCDAQAHTLRAYSGESEDGQTFTVAWRDLRLENGALTEGSVGRATAERGDDLFIAASTFDATNL